MKHTSCPNCGSRDNLAMYDDGSGHCFGCHYYIHPKHVSISALQASRGELAPSNELQYQPPPDLDTNFSQEAWEWLQKYEITMLNCLEHNIFYSPKYNQIVFLWKDADDHVLGWQARNFSEGRKKYFTQAEVNSLVRIYSSRNPNVRMVTRSDLSTLVLVEDVISAIKVSHFCDAMPVLGSGLGNQYLTRLSNLYSNVIIWLDSNMYQNALKMGEALTMLGVNAYPLYTELDPKEYRYPEIAQYLQKTPFFVEKT